MNQNQLKAERRFLMEDVISIGVLTHSKKYENYTPELFFQEIEKGIELFSKQILSDFKENDNGEKGQSLKLEGGRVLLTEWFHDQWKQFQLKEWTTYLTPEKYGGKELPKSLEAILLESCQSGTFPLISAAFFTNVVANLIERYGDDSLKKMFCEELYALNWGGCISLMESAKGVQFTDKIATIAIKEQDRYKIKGEKDWVFWGDHDLTDQIVHLVSARIGSSPEKKGKLALFIVPKIRIEKGEKIDNRIGASKINPISENENLPIVTLSFGIGGDCYGYLLCEISNEENSHSALQDISRRIVFEQISHLYGVYQIIPESNSPSFLYLKALIEGLRSSVITAFFYDDCSLLGGEKQKQKFEHLLDLYSSLFPVYISRSLAKIDQCFLDLDGAGCLAVGNQRMQHLQYIKSLSLLMGSQEQNALNLVRRMTSDRGTEMIETLLANFQEIDSHLAVSEALREAVLIWQEYIGALIVTIDDLKRAQLENDKPLLYSELVIDLLGDLIVCFHLIKQGIEAEKKLLDYQTNFFLLKKEVQKNEALRKWYNKLITVEFFATNILSQHEGTLKIIQRYSASFTELLPEIEEE